MKPGPAPPVYTGPGKLVVLPMGVTGDDLAEEKQRSGKRVAPPRRPMPGAVMPEQGRRHNPRSPWGKWIGDPKLDKSKPRPRESRPKSTRRCGRCRKPGHNAQTCGRGRR